MARTQGENKELVAPDKKNGIAGKYRIKLADGYDRDSGARQYRQKTITGTEKQAQAVLNRWIGEKLLSEKKIHTGNITIGQQATRWLRTQEKRVGKDGSLGISPSTYDGYQYIVEGYIIRDLDEIKLADFTVSDVNEIILEWSEALAISTLKTAKVVFGMVFESAIGDSVISQNVVKKANKITGEREVKHGEENLAKNLKTLTEFQMQAFQAHAKEADENYTLWTLLFHTGLRIGEGVALTWKHLTDDNYIQVRRTQIRFKPKGSDVKVWGYGPPKTKHSKRDVSISDKMRAELDVHLAKQKLLLGEDFDEAGLIFRNPDEPTERLARSKAANSFCRIAKAIGIGHTTRTHLCRHTHASLCLLDNPKDLQWLSQRLGRADPAFTLKVYAHAMPGREKDFHSTMDRFQFGSTIELQKEA